MKIAKYEFGSPWNKISVTLYPEKLVISGRDSAGNFVDDEVDLKNLSGKKAVVRAKDDLRKAIWGLPGILIFIGSIYFWERMAAKSTILFYTVILGSISLMLFGFAVAKRVNVYAYKSHAGDILFTITDRGKKVGELQEFALKLEKVIEAQPVAGGDATR